MACTQKPAAAVIGGLVKSNFPVRLVGSVPSPEDAKVATGLARTGAEKLQGQGDFLVVTKGRATRMQVAYIAPREVRQWVVRLRDRTAALPLLLEATGTDGQGTGTAQPNPVARLRSRLRSRLRVVK